MKKNANRNGIETFLGFSIATTGIQTMVEVRITSKSFFLRQIRQALSLPHKRRHTFGLSLN
ncbi:MAG: hypothetical protein ABI172_09670 [Ginsengibacter sp.]